MVDYELNELRREFLAEAEAKVREIEEAIGGSRDPQSIERLAYLAHQLKGSGGSYGYARISADAAEIERVAEEIAGGSRTDGGDTTLRERVRSLRQEIEKSVQELVA
jgi:HPt (histidine-containing phosphotransfer) domain-containing protein